MFVRVTIAAISLAAPTPLLATPIIRSVSLTGTRMPVHFETHVGQPFDSETITRDVRRLWESSRFEDIRVELADGIEGVAITFHVVEQPMLHLRRIVIEPDSYGLKFDSPRGRRVTPVDAQRLATRAREALIARGYTGVTVDAALLAYSGNQADVRLAVHAAVKPARVRRVRLAGAPPRAQKELREPLRAARGPYSEELAESVAARLRSVYVANGYLDATVEVRRTETHPGGIALEFRVDAGRRFEVRQWNVRGLAASASPPQDLRGLCNCVFHAREAAERDGVLDFDARLHIEPAGPSAVDLKLDVIRGRAYRTGRIEISGNHHYRDETVRSNLLLDEGAVFDSGLLRKSVQQLNRSRLFEPVRFEQVQIRSDERTGTASVELQLKERARGSWLISGPVGPPRFAGPLRASIETRLPGWSHAAFDLSTYGISLSLVAFAAPLSGQRILPVLMLRKPYLPGSGWLSGFTFAPRLGWRFPAIAYAATQLQQRAITWLEDDAVPPLTIAVERSGSTRPLICPAPKRRFATMRRIGLLGLEVAEAAGSF